MKKFLNPNELAAIFQFLPCLNCLANAKSAGSPLLRFWPSHLYGSPIRDNQSSECLCNAFIQSEGKRLTGSYYKGDVLIFNDQPGF